MRMLWKVVRIHTLPKSEFEQFGESSVSWRLTVSTSEIVAISGKSGENIIGMHFIFVDLIDV